MRSGFPFFAMSAYICRDIGNQVFRSMPGILERFEPKRALTLAWTASICDADNSDVPPVFVTQSVGMPPATFQSSHSSALPTAASK
jgi:hypothetical protein